MSKKIAVKVCKKTIVATISEEFLNDINSFIQKNHYNSKAELARAAIRKLLNGSNICDFMENHFYGSKAELLRESLREFIKPAVQIVSQISQNKSHVINEERNNLKDINAKIAEAKKWEKLAVIPFEGKKWAKFAYHPYRGRKYAIASSPATRKSAMDEMQNNPLFQKQKARVEA